MLKSVPCAWCEMETVDGDLPILENNYTSEHEACFAMGMFASKEKKGKKGPKFAVPDAQDKAMLELHRSKNRIQKYSARVGGP